MSSRPIHPIAAGSTRWIALAALAAALAAIAGAVFASSGNNVGAWVHWIAKPLTTALLFALAWLEIDASRRYRILVLLGIALSLVGDVWLMLPADYFVAGLLSFLLAHLCFIGALCSDVRFATPAWPWLVCLVVGAIYMWMLWTGVAPALRVPVIGYMLVLASMAGQALGRWRAFSLTGDPRAASARLAAIGGLVFMLSDSLLAWDRFRTSLPFSAVCVLGTYYVALWLIARSVARSAAPSEWRMQ